VNKNICFLARKHFSKSCFLDSSGRSLSIKPEMDNFQINLQQTYNQNEGTKGFTSA
jgi:hypothetical protein